MCLPQPFFKGSGHYQADPTGSLDSITRFDL